MEKPKKLLEIDDWWRFDERDIRKEINDLMMYSNHSKVEQVDMIMEMIHKAYSLGRDDGAENALENS